VVDILVVGESSASGVPYDEWFSVADIVAWKLQDAFPQLLKAGKPVDSLAYPGVGPIAEAMEASPQPSH
jgi:hypothetical protein